MSQARQDRVGERAPIKSQVYLFMTFIAVIGETKSAPPSTWNTLTGSLYDRFQLEFQFTCNQPHASNDGGSVWGTDGAKERHKIDVDTLERLFGIFMTTKYYLMISGCWGSNNCGARARVHR